MADFQDIIFTDTHSSDIAVLQLIYLRCIK